jgi:hypothetical protein
MMTDHALSILNPSYVTAVGIEPSYANYIYMDGALGTHNNKAVNKADDMSFIQHDGGSEW